MVSMQVDLHLHRASQTHRIPEAPLEAEEHHQLVVVVLVLPEQPAARHTDHPPALAAPAKS